MISRLEVRQRRERVTELAILPGPGLVYDKESVTIGRGREPTPWSSASA